MSTNRGKYHLSLTNLSFASGKLSSFQLQFPLPVYLPSSLLQARIRNLHFCCSQGSHHQTQPDGPDLHPWVQGERTEGEEGVRRCELRWAVLAEVSNTLNYKSKSSLITKITCSVHRWFCFTATKCECGPACTENTLPVLAFTDDKASLG